jgi:hypothetical protein
METQTTKTTEDNDQSFTVTGTEETFDEKKYRDEKALRDVFPKDESLKDVQVIKGETKEETFFEKVKKFFN